MDETLEKLFQKIKFQPGRTRNFIYIIESANLYKIGFTTNIEARIQVIKTSSPHEVKLIYIIPIPMEIEHKKVENALHKMFESSHMKGEWFNLSLKDIAKIKSLSLQDILLFADEMEKSKNKDQLSFFPPDKPEDE